MSDTLLNAEQVAEKLGLTPRTVRNMANRGEIIGMLVASTWRFEESDVEAYIAQQKARTAETVKKARKSKASESVWLDPGIRGRTTLNGEELEQSSQHELKTG